MSDATADSPPLAGGCLCRRVRCEARPDHREGCGDGVQPGEATRAER